MLSCGQPSQVYFLTEITAHAAKLGAVIFLFPLQKEKQAAKLQLSHPWASPPKRGQINRFSAPQNLL